MNPSVKLKCIARKNVAKSDKAKQGNSLTIPSNGDNLIVEIKKIFFLSIIRRQIQIKQKPYFSNGKIYNKTRHALLKKTPGAFLGSSLNLMKILLSL